MSSSDSRKTLGVKSLVVIPARMASTRLPEKMLLRETGKPLIQHTYESASQALCPSGVIVATDHEAIAGAVISFGGRVQMTDPQARSGTDRVAEIAQAMPEIDIFVNVQGDEPEIPGASIDLTIELLTTSAVARMSTLATPIRTKEQLQDPACVKVVFDVNHRALYFSRSPIPHPREWDDTLLDANPPHFYQHVGIYAYRRDFLLQLATMPQSGLEQVEKLEQLRVLHFGHQILVGVVEEPTNGIDTPADYDAFVRRFRN